MAGPVAAGSDELAHKLASAVRQGRLPGAAAGIVHGSELAWSAGAGFASVADRRPAGPATLYRIASITKTFTGTAVMQLRDSGRLTLDDPAVTWIPELRKASSPFAPIEALTIRRLLSHESGLAGDPPGTDWAGPAYEGQVGRTLDRASEIATVAPPHRQLKYSNLGYQLLGEIVSRAAGVPYPEYLRAAILDPLGVTGTGFEPLPEALAGRRATGYAERTFSDELDLAPAMPPVWAEGGLWSCVDDLARWAALQLRAHPDPAAGPADRAGAAGDAAILAAASLREMHQPRYLADDAWTSAWGISWSARRHDDVIWIEHSGGLPGFSTSLCFDPGERVAAIVLINGTADPAGLAMDLGAVARRLVRAAPPAIVPPAPAPAAYRPLLGLYAWPDGSLMIRLEWRDGKLTVVDPQDASWRPALAPTGDPDAFTVEPGCREAGEAVVFRRLPDGRVSSLSFAGNTLARLDRVGPPQPGLTHTGE